MITEMISIMVGGMTDIMDGIASQPILLAGMALFLIFNGIHTVNSLMKNMPYDGYSPEEYAQHQEEYEQLKQEAIENTRLAEENAEKEYPLPIKVKPKRKLNYSVCPVCNAPVDNSRDDCKYCGSLYV